MTGHDIMPIDPIRTPPPHRTTLRVALAVALLAATPAVSAQDVGRLFFTPQQRQDLDRRRDLNIVDRPGVVVPSVTVNGHVTRSSGKTTTWINGVPQYDTYHGRAPDRVAVPSGAAAQGVKVGQTLDHGKGEVRDPLQGGQIKVNRAPQ
jgi:hypothetical protein